MIIKMTRVRLMGPRELLEPVLHELQLLGVVHLASPRARRHLEAYQPAHQEIRTGGYLRRLLDDVETALDLMDGDPGSRQARTGRTPPPDFPRWARAADRVRRELERIAARAAGLQEERQLIAKYQLLFRAFEPFLRAERETPNLHAFYFLMRPDQQSAIESLRHHLEALVEDEFEFQTHRLATGDIALLLLVPTHRVDPVEGVLSQAAIQPIPIPPGYGGDTLAQVLPDMEAKLRRIPAELRALEARRRRMARQHGPDFVHARWAVHDRLLELEALPRASVSPRAFVLEGWVPSPTLGRVRGRMGEAFGEDVVVETVATQEWAGEEAPVALRNPRLFRPFELLTQLLPLPRYGSVDPTPYVAVFFPMFFGIVLGDVGYGAALALVALILRLRSRRDSVLRSVSEIATACALFTTIFGALYGELLGDLGRRWFGLHPVLMDREETIVPFLVLAIALGVVHVLIGLVLGAVSSLRHDPRKSVGRGLAAVMVALIVTALLAAVEILPRPVFTPVVVAVVALFPLLVVAEGIIAPIELMSTVGNILSYARIMAVGTASVMMAVVANRFAGALGSALVGLLFALLFHLVNFVIGVFSPTIHVLRLHYVEFFGKFYSPGGTEYRPFGLWHPHGDAGRA